jgi:hypothetical protein
LGVVQKLLVSTAPRALTLVSLLSLVVVFAALAYAIYAVVIWLTLASVQPGWFTISLMLSMTAAFLGIALFGLSIGVQKLIEMLSNDVADDIVEECSAVDMFGQAMNELNVEIATDHAAAAIPPERVQARR